MKRGHDKAVCMCDDCIKARVRAEVAMRDQRRAADAYIRRRGSGIGDDPPPSKLRGR